MIRSYRELRALGDLRERFEYLSLAGIVGEQTFGTERYLNQRFYRSTEWKHARDFVIVRDYGFDLGDPDTPIRGNTLVHHINPLTLEDITEGSEALFDPDNLISTSLRSHNAIHFGDWQQLPLPPVERRPGDTTPWKT